MSASPEVTIRQPSLVDLSTAAVQQAPPIRRSSHRDRPHHVVLANHGRGETSHCLAAEHHTTPAYHQYFLHYGMLRRCCFSVPNIIAKVRGLLTTRPREVTVACLFIEFSPSSYTAVLSLSSLLSSCCVWLSLAVSTCSSIYLMRQDVISGGCCLVAQALHRSAPHGHRTSTEARSRKTDRWLQTCMHFHTGPCRACLPRASKHHSHDMLWCASRKTQFPALSHSDLHNNKTVSLSGCRLQSGI